MLMAVMMMMVVVMVTCRITTLHRYLLRQRTGKPNLTSRIVRGVRTLSDSGEVCRLLQPGVRADSE